MPYRRRLGLVVFCLNSGPDGTFIWAGRVLNAPQFDYVYLV